MISCLQVFRVFGRWELIVARVGYCQGGFWRYWVLILMNDNTCNPLGSVPVPKRWHVSGFSFSCNDSVQFGSEPVYIAPD